MTTTDKPIVAGWLRSGSEFSDTSYKFLRRTSHRSTFHGVRAPMYAARLALMAPRGLFRTLRAIWRLVFDYESQALRLEHRDRGETPEYVKLRRMRDERVKTGSSLRRCSSYCWPSPDWSAGGYYPRGRCGPSPAARYWSSAGSDGRSTGR